MVRHNNAWDTLEHVIATNPAAVSTLHCICAVSLLCSHDVKMSAPLQRVLMRKGSKVGEHVQDTERRMSVTALLDQRKSEVC